MKVEYDFSHGKRGALDKISTGKVRITIRLDEDIIAWFRQQADEAGGGNYQTMINQALKDYIYGQQQPVLEDLLRRVVREELENYR